MNCPLNDPFRIKSININLETIIIIKKKRKSITKLLHLPKKRVRRTHEKNLLVLLTYQKQRSNNDQIHIRLQVSLFPTS